MSDGALPRGRRGAGAATLASWTLFAAGCTWTLVNLLRVSPRTLPPIGDQPSYLAEALSLLHDHDLVYQVVDQQRMQSFYAKPWGVGLFLTHTGHGWVYAKPLTYPAWLAIWIGLFGPRGGVIVGNGILFALVAVVVVAMLRRAYSGPAVPLVATAFLFFSNVSFYAYTVTPDLLLTLEVAVLAWATLHAVDRAKPAARRLVWSALAMAVLGLFVADKPPMLVISVPVVVLIVACQVGWRRLVPLGALASLVLVRVALRVAHVQGAGWNAYQGDRWFTANVCFPGTAGSRALPWRTADTFSVAFARHGLAHGYPDKLRASWAYLVGEHTGVLVFLPLAVLVVILVVAQGRRMSLESLAFLALLACYVGFYVVFFPENYFGGAASIGNRYFVQISPVVIALAVAANLPARRVVVAACVSMAIGAAMLWPNLRDPHVAFWRTDRRTLLQRNLSVSEQSLFDARHTLDVDNTVVPVEVPRPQCVPAP